MDIKGKDLRNREFRPHGGQAKQVWRKGNTADVDRTDNRVIALPILSGRP
jgi:hypothetical protein